MDTIRETDAAGRFSCSLSERASFEAGIKMATIYHQFVGTPFCEANVEDLEKTIGKCICTQPYVENAVVKIRRGCGDKSDQYSYTSLTGDMIDAVVTIRIEDTVVVAEMRFDEVLNYPLMYVSSVQTV